MSQSGSTGPNATPNQGQVSQQGSNQQQPQSESSQSGASNFQTSSQNGRADAAPKTSENSKTDMSNGFENRTIDYDRFVAIERNQTGMTNFQPIHQTRISAQCPSTASELAREYSDPSQQTTTVYPTARRMSVTVQPEERHSMSGQPPPQQYPTDSASLERSQYVSQTGTQTVPVQAQPHFVPDYVTEQPPQYTHQMRAGQFEVRSQIYTQQQQQQQQQQQPREYSDRAGYVTRDVTYRERAGTALYAHPQSTGNAVFTGTGPYVTVQHAGSQLPSQSASPQPPYYSGVVISGQGPTGYGAFAPSQPQYPYSQYPQTVMNPIPYNPLAQIYQPQQINQQSSNPQRFSQDMSQYQAQPIIQPIAQNVMGGPDRPIGRGPKPMVPPRGNSKITHGDLVHRKSATGDVAAPKPKLMTPSVQNPLVSQEQVLRNESTLLLATTGQVIPDGQERRFLSPINRNPRTRQDGLYVDSNGEQITREKTMDAVALECGLYVSRSEHRKSVSVDVTTSFQRRNDTITFTFPGESNPQDGLLVVGAAAAAATFPVEPRRIEPIVRVSPMNFDSRTDNCKSSVTDRKPEWGNVSPNPRSGAMSAQENRRSDYFEDHRRSPLTLDAKRTDDVRRSPMAFVPIKDPSGDRATQKNASFANQNFEKTRQELAMWAEQRQRQEMERGMHSNQIFSTSPRLVGQSEDRRDPASMVTTDELKKDPRMSQAGFQPIPNISQSSIIEQRRHLRHVSADLTKHMELSRKDFEDQPITGSVANLVPAMVSTASSQRASPNICHQYPALSEAKLDSNIMQLTVITDFGDNHVKSSSEHSDHIIHSHRKGHNVSTNLLTHSKSQADNLQGQTEQCEGKGDAREIQQQSQQQQQEHQHQQSQQQSQQQQQQQQHQQQQQQHQLLQNQQMQNQQSLDLISEKLSQFERQQIDLQAKLQCLQNQNQILDKVAQYQNQQTDLQVRFQCLQDRQVGDNSLSETTEYQPQSLIGELRQIQLNPPTDNLDQQTNEKMNSDKQNLQSQSSHRQSIHNVPTYVSSHTLQSQIYQSLNCGRLSPRLTVVESTDVNSTGSQITLPGNSQFERSDGARGSLQYRLACPTDIHENAIAGSPVPSASGIVVGSNAALGNITGTLKKVPPEKPPRTSIMVQSPETEQQESAGHRTEADTEDEEMDDHEIQSTVESILGPGVKVIDCEKKNSVREEEVLLINGVPIALEGPDGVAIREAMITGQIPPCDLLNQILVRAGILRAPVRLETSMSVKSTVVTTEEITVARDGKVVDERSRETKENNFYASSTSEIWEPVGIIDRSRNVKPFDESDESRPNSNASSDQGYTTNTSSNNHVLRERGGAGYDCPTCEDVDPNCAKHCLGGLSGLGSDNGTTTRVPGVRTTTSAPTIFGTVASDLNPKEGNSRRSLPQTPAGGVGTKGLGGGVGGSGGAGPGCGMVNGATSDHHQDIRDGNAISPEHALVYRDGALVSGSLEALVQHMVPTEEYYPDRAYLFAFLLSARLFIKPHELLGEVCALCEHQQNLNGEGGKERLHRFVPRLVQLLAEWTETFPYDFRDERVMGHVRSITQKVAAVDAAARQEVSALLQNLLLRLTALERYEEGLARLATEAATEQLTQVDVTELCPSATVLAQQLTHVELERLSYIGPEEFVQAFAKESPHLETSFKDMKKTRNLESYVQWFNRLSYFVATEVCKHAKKKQRVRVVEYWIETARECFNIGNFNSLMAIIAGLNMSPISRLKKTWSKVQSAKFMILEHQMDPSSNFSSYRSTLKAAMWRSAGATDERQRIVVPFFSLLVKDLYFLNEGCSNKLPNGHINFEKFWQLAKQVTEFIAWKQVACPFEKNSRVIAFLQASPVLTENALALASFECEPPDNNPEKERYKVLKSELNTQ